MLERGFVGGLMAKAMARNRKVTQKKSNSSLWLIAGIVVAVVLVGALILINLNANRTSTGAPSPVNAGRVLGNADAPVTIDLYADFQCPVCRQQEEIFRQIAPQYIDSGKAKIVFHNFPFIGAESTLAAQAAECADDQGKFWDYASYLYDHQTGENVGAFSASNLTQFAHDLKLNTDTFSACLNSGEHAAVIAKELKEGEARGVTATPTVVINGQTFVGLVQQAQLTSLIDSLQPKS
jgi:protein-disulfide isomerase